MLSSSLNWLYSQVNVCYMSDSTLQVPMQPAFTYSIQNPVERKLLFSHQFQKKKKAWAWYHWIKSGHLLISEHDTETSILSCFGWSTPSHTTILRWQDSEKDQMDCWLHSAHPKYMNMGGGVPPKEIRMLLPRQWRVDAQEAKTQMSSHSPSL